MTILDAERRENHEGQNLKLEVFKEKIFHRFHPFFISKNVTDESRITTRITKTYFPTVAYNHVAMSGEIAADAEKTDTLKE